MKSNTGLFLAFILQLFLIVLVLECQAQQFSIEMISPISNTTNEEAIDYTDSGLLLGKYGLSKQCHFLYSLQQKELVKLCEKGLHKAFDVNDSGVVVGVARRNKQDVAAVWNQESGLKIIGKLSPDDTFSVALGINNKDQVVGYSGRTEEGYDDEGYPAANYIYHPFIYDSKKGLRYLFRNRSKKAAAFQISNRGKILVAVEPTESSYNWNLMTATIRGQLTTLPGDPQVIYPGYGLEGNYDSLSIADGGFVGAFYNLFDISRNTAERLPRHFSLGRGDYGYSMHINDKGEGAGTLGDGVGWFYTPDKRDLEISCLTPQNALLDKSKLLRVSDLTIDSVAAITNRGDIAFTGELNGDYKNHQIFVARKLNEPISAIYDFCPKLNAAVVGECNSYFEQHTESLIYSEQISYIPPGKECTVKAFFSSTNGDTRQYGGLRINLDAEDYSSSHQYESCDSVTKDSALSGLAGAPTQLNFNYSSRVNQYDVYGPVNDERMRIDTAYFYIDRFATHSDDPICYNAQ